MKKEKENLLRLRLVLETVAANLLKNLLLQDFSNQPNELFNHLQKPSVQRKFEKEKQKRKLTEEEWRKINGIYATVTKNVMADDDNFVLESNTETNNLDKAAEAKLRQEYKRKETEQCYAKYTRKLGVKVLALFIQKLSSYTGPNTGWNNWPEEHNKTTVANIIRLKLVNEQLEGVTHIENALFEKYWMILERSLLGLGYHQAGINNLKSCCVGFEEGYWSILNKAIDKYRLLWIAAGLLLICIIYSELYNPIKPIQKPPL